MPIELVEKDCGYALAAGGGLPLIAATREHLCEAIAQGLAEAPLRAVVPLDTRSHGGALRAAPNGLRQAAARGWTSTVLDREDIDMGGV